MKFKKLLGQNFKMGDKSNTLNFVQHIIPTGLKYVWLFLK